MNEDRSRKYWKEINDNMKQFDCRPHRFVPKKTMRPSYRKRKDIITIIARTNPAVKTRQFKSICRTK